MINKLAFRLGIPNRLPEIMPLFTHGRMNPSFFIVGFQKCGTTTLYDALCKHPNVIPGLMKENNLLAEPKQRLSEFKLSFPYKRKGKITGDASHLHTWMPYGLERIKKYYPNAKILVIMRNPIDRAFSHYNMDLKFGYIPKSMSFEELVHLELNLRAGIQNEENVESVYEHLKLFGNKYGWPVSRGIYWIYLKGLQGLDIEFQPIFLEHLKSDYSGVMKGVFNYLNLEGVNLTPFSSNKGSYTQKLDGAVLDLLKGFYKPHNQKLQELLNKELPW